MDAGDEPLRRQAILVAGMHRSGTSVLTRVLSLLGADLPDNLLPPMDGVNELGFWESQDLVSLHESLLVSAGSNWADWAEFNSDWYQSGEADRYQQQIRMYLDRDFRGSPLFVIKEPRICRFLPVWLDVLAVFKADPVIIIPVRHPLEVAHSLAKRDDMPLHKGVLLWLRYVLDAVHGSTGLRRAFVSYEGLLEDWRKVLLSIQQQTDLVFPHSFSEAEIEIDQYVDARYRNNTVSPSALTDGGEFHELVSDAYQALLQLVDGVNTDAALSVLAEARRDFGKSSDVYAKLFRHEEVRVDELKQQLLCLEREMQEQRSEMRDRLGAMQWQQAILEGKHRLSLDNERRLGVVLGHVVSDRRSIEGSVFPVLHRDIVRYREAAECSYVGNGLLPPKLSWKRQKEQARLVLLIRESMLFDGAFYSEHYPDAANYPGGGIAHYLEVGVALGYDPHPLFSTSWYLSGNADVHHSGVNPLVHFIQDGYKEGRSPHPLFDIGWYFKLNPDVQAAGANPLVHYLQAGYQERRHPHPLFDAVWYISVYLKEQEENPLVHFVRSGAELFYRPTPLFWTEHFCQTYPLVSESGLNPLEFYIKYGAAWHYTPNPLFDSQFYCERADIGPDISGTPLGHFLLEGASRGLSPSALFDVSWYFNTYPYVRASGVNPLAHYLEQGEVDGLQPNLLFDPIWYAGRNFARLEGRGALIDYVLFGIQERRNPALWFDAQWYVDQDIVLQATRVDPLEHYLATGMLEGRKTHSELLLANRVLPSTALATATDVPSAIQPTEEEWRVVVGRAAVAAVDVIIPVYKGRAETLRCIHSVLLASVQCDFCLLVINDASPDPVLAEVLRDFAGQGLFLLLENETNLGFVGTVNRGMSLHAGRDVVLLNADTEVYDGWLDRMLATAQTHSKSATITPLSNNATICSYPRFMQDNPMLLEVDYGQLDALTAAVNQGEVVQAPTGVGFCMYIRRVCLNELGLFDQDAFGRGYGEENDFCQRAQAAGWSNLIAADVFVRHWGSASFQGERIERVQAAMQVLDQRYPDYQRVVHEYIVVDPLLAVRERLDWARLELCVRDTNVLIVCHNRGGGTERHVQEDVRRFLQKGTGVFFLRPDAEKPTQVRLSHPEAEPLPNLPSFELSDKDALIAVWTRLNITEVHTHGLVDFAPDAPDTLAELIAVFKQASSQVRWEVNVHDYKVICPRITLTDQKGRYCGEPDVMGCSQCLRDNGSAFDVEDIVGWRAMHGRVLEAADVVSVPDQDVAMRLQRYFPQLVCDVSPHEVLDVPEKRVVLPALTEGRVLRVVVIGAINQHKGFDVLLALAHYVQANGLPLEFFVLGYTSDDKSIKSAGVSVVGRYEEADASGLLQAMQADVVWLPSLWPETYSYTLSLALEAGLPVMAFDLGAIARRLRELGRGELLMPLEWADRPSKMVEFLLAQCGQGGCLAAS